MEKNNVENAPLPESEDTRSELLKEGEEQWLDEHGKPNYSYLESLVKWNSPEALEELRGIADDHNVAYDSETTSEELANRIRLALETEDGHAG